MQIKIRKATIKDVDQIYEVFLGMVRSENKAMRDTNKYLTRLREKRDDFTISSKRGLRQEIKAKNTYYLVAVANDKIVAYARGEIKYSKNLFFKRVRTGHLHSLAVLKKYRKKGIASRLHREIEQWFKKRKCIQMNLFVLENNPAIDIYKKWGYKTFVNTMSKKL